MDAPSIALAVQRVEESLARKPGLAVHDDMPARSVWVDGLRSRVHTPDGTALHTDLGTVMGGDGAGMPPGWLLRAALATCLSTSVALHAARRGVTLRRLEVNACSRSDARGLLGSTPGVPAGPLQVSLELLIEADGADDDTLRDLVAWADAHSPVSQALRSSVDLQLRVERTGG